MSHADRPTASLETLRLRARLLAATRDFFDARGAFEVDTPLLSADRVIDSHIDPFEVRPADSPRAQPLYLQTSPEFAMKRLLAAGAPAIYQLGKVFRAGERGTRHNPEFTLLEWYEPAASEADIMSTTEQLVRALVALAPERRVAALAADCAAPFIRTTYSELFQSFCGFDPLITPTPKIEAVARAQLGDSVPASLAPDDRDGWLNLLLAERIEPHLGQEDGPQFVTEYPASQAALAQTRLRPDGAVVAGRFELYWLGLELCNGYHELTDPVELRRRIATTSQERARNGLPPLPQDSGLLRAMEAGLPPCAGNAVGFDRLVMRIVGARTIDEVIPFPLDRA